MRDSATRMSLLERLYTDQEYIKPKNPKLTEIIRNVPFKKSL